MTAAGGRTAGLRGAVVARGWSGRAGAAWPAVVLGWTATFVGARLLGLGGPAGAVVGLGFALTCPGAAIVGLLAVPDRLARAVLAVTVSLSVDAAAGTVLFYAGAWSAAAAVSVLVAVSVTGAGLQLAAVPRR